jgi:toxin-antitoxin system PIN domain toxin
MTKMYLLDINVWLALAFDSHVHHPRAKVRFDALTNERCHFCRLTQQGLLRLATNPKAFGEGAVSMDRAWQLYDAFLSDGRIAFAEEPAGLEALWRLYTAGQSFSPKTWNDGYLAAFARASNWEFVSFDQGFVRYEGLKTLVPA